MSATIKTSSPEIRVSLSSSKPKKLNVTMASPKNQKMLIPKKSKNLKK
jgi:hypothetical protein